ncbi:hypothetical protein Dimus_002565 [Dionaea muscipula]
MEQPSHGLEHQAQQGYLVAAGSQQSQGYSGEWITVRARNRSKQDVGRRDQENVNLREGSPGRWKILEEMNPVEGGDAVDPWALSDIGAYDSRCLECKGPD